MIFCQLESFISNHLQQIQKKKKKKKGQTLCIQEFMNPLDFFSFCVVFIYITALTWFLNQDWGPVLLHGLLEREFSSPCTAWLTVQFVKTVWEEKQWERGNATG